MAAQPKTLSDQIREIKIGSTKKFTNIPVATIRATAGRVLGAGNYRVEKVGEVDDQVTKVTRLV